MTLCARCQRLLTERTDTPPPQMLNVGEAFERVQGGAVMRRQCDCWYCQSSWTMTKDSRGSGVLWTLVKQGPAR